MTMDANPHFIDGAARVAAVIGDPINHSLSPKLHGYWLKEYNINGAYVPFCIKPDNLESAVEHFYRSGIVGWNVTLPHKEAIIPYLEEIDGTAQKIGAVNTVFRDDYNRLCGTNTDAYGFIENIRALAPSSWEMTQGPAVVLGAGGAAKAVLYGLKEAGVPSVILLNRTIEKAEELAELYPDYISVQPWEEREQVLSGINFLINTTSLGMKGKHPLDLSLDALPSSALVTDIVYTPLMTPLLQDAKERGNPIVDGLGMLLHQAVAGFELWFGVKPDVSDALRHHMIQSFND